MKLLIAISLFVVASALPLANKPLREGPPIIFRHREPTPESDVRNLQNEHNRFEIIKNILNRLQPPRNPEDKVSLNDKKKALEEILDALNIINHILNDNEDDDDDNDDDVTSINVGEHENQADIVPDNEEEAVNLEAPPHREEPNSNDDNADDGSQPSNIANDVESSESKNSNEIPNKHQNPDRNQSQPEDEENLEEDDENDSQSEDEEVVDVIKLIPHINHKGIEFKVPNVVEQQPK
ncbi:GATOR complex protein WDR24-like [Vanessa cardui]|uniref:GATOR complex protein WDR24-like n=1 Tax=Vanessa cardui TaxID=171605 RepID=UPI001F13ED84|nr:GATOR complex protein WDR24-like [Vanessa cardui]